MGELRKAAIVFVAVVALLWVVTGSGAARGNGQTASIDCEDVAEIVPDDDATLVEPGVAFDSAGRPIIVEDDTAEEIPDDEQGDADEEEATVTIESPSAGDHTIRGEITPVELEFEHTARGTITITDADEDEEGKDVLVDLEVLAPPDDGVVTVTCEEDGN